MLLIIRIDNESRTIKLLDFIAKTQDTQFVIPIYQRIYSWDKKQCLQLWAVCEISINSLNKTFASFSKNLKKEKYLESAQAHFLLLRSYTRFSSDVKEALMKKDFYHFAKKTYCFKELENYKRKEEVSIDKYTIEHIMPQNLNKLWQKDLGEKYQVIHDK